MAEMACTLLPIGSNADSCVENYAGVEANLYHFFEDDLKAAPEVDNTKAEYTADSFALKAGAKFTKIPLKPQVNKVDATSNGANKGYSNVATVTVVENEEAMAYNLRVMNNRPSGFLIPDGNGKFYVIYSPMGRTEISVSSTTGDAPNSDKGDTLTLTANPMAYPKMKWSGTPTDGAA